LSARLNTRFAALKREGRAGLVAYVMANDPDLDTSFEILRGLPAAGADVIELGFAFTDPMADGFSIQRAAERALKAGSTLRKTLDLVARFRKHDKDTPIVLMGYANPIEQFGHASFADAASKAGVDGIIVVDIPPEEDAELRGALDAKQMSLIRLATPTTDDKRLPVVVNGVSGFLYYVSVAGVTGANAATNEHVRAAVARLKKATTLPIAVGFGVREPQAARAIAQVADAVVVGSAFVDEVTSAVNDGKPGEAPARVLRKVKSLSEAVRAARELEGSIA
jgi:tryptophan synthase alpha chain